MRRIVYAMVASSLLCVATAASPAAADPVKVGILVTTTGPYAIWGKGYEQAIQLYLEQHNGKDGNPDVQVIYRDVGGDNPPRARQLAQELVVRDGVAILGGLEFTTTVLAMADVINEAKIPFVIFNSATSFVTDKSPYYVRASFTQWQAMVPAAKWALAQNYRKCATLVADYAPGKDAVDAFTKGFTDGGGRMIDNIRVPLGTTDFSSYFQRVQDDAPQCLVTFMPLGPMSAGVIKGFAERNLKSKMQLIGSGETPEFDLPAIGDAAIGTVTALHYGPYLDNPQNNAFRAAMLKKYGPSGLPSFVSVQAYDGMEIIFHMLKATGGKRDADAMMAAIKGYHWLSPRGPVTVDPQTRELIQNIYIRRVERVHGMLINQVIDTYHDVKDPWHEYHAAK